MSQRATSAIPVRDLPSTPVLVEAGTKALSRWETDVTPAFAIVRCRGAALRAVGWHCASWKAVSVFVQD